LSPRRSKLQLSMELLHQIYRGESKPTRLMYATNLSWNNLQELLESLVAQGLVNETVASNTNQRAKKRYEITPKGENVLRYYSMVEDLIKIER